MGEPLRWQNRFNVTSTKSSAADFPYLWSCRPIDLRYDGSEGKLYCRDLQGSASTFPSYLSPFGTRLSFDPFLHLGFHLLVGKGFASVELLIGFI